MLVKKTIGVHFPHRAGNTITPTWSADKPAVEGQGIIGVFHGTDGSSFMEV